MVEHSAVNRGVVGSSPTRSARQGTDYLVSSRYRNSRLLADWRQAVQEIAERVFPHLGYEKT